MPARAEHSLSLAGQLAEDLLKAWISGNPARVHTELERSSSVPIKAYDVSEEERRYLLKAVAAKMRTRPGLLEVEDRDQDPMLSLCLNLLKHLVAPRIPAGGHFRLH
jgi:hypothetical protein